MREKIKLTTSFGHRISAFKNDSITGEIQRHGVYDRWTLAAIENLLDAINADVSLDVGANIGNHALAMTLVSKQVVAFEPVPFIHQVLSENLQANTDNSVAACVALSDRKESARITISGNGNLGQSSMAAEAESDESLQGENVRIESVIGDEFVEQHLADSAGVSVDFIKVDVEGFEPRVVTGLSKTIRDHQPLVLLEWNSASTIEQFEKNDIFNTVFRNYRVYSLTHHGSKQVSGRGLLGAVKRWGLKVLNKNSFCIDTFHSSRTYPNVLFIPERWHSLVQGLPKCQK